jgi:hypothetical protein
VSPEASAIAQIKAVNLEAIAIPLVELMDGFIIFDWCGAAIDTVFDTPAVLSRKLLRG